MCRRNVSYGQNSKENRQGVVLQVHIWRWGSYHLSKRKLCYTVSRQDSGSLQERTLTETRNDGNTVIGTLKGRNHLEDMEIITGMEGCSLNWFTHIFWMLSLLQTYSLTGYKKSWRTYLENMSTFMYSYFNTVYVNVTVEYTLRTLFLFSFSHP
jgi:hypothetical protein